jgi:hypothetical protein
VKPVDDLADRRRQQLPGGVEAEHPRGGLVGVHQHAFAALDRDGLGERRERDRELRLDRLELREQARVVERERRAAGQHLRELEILVAIAPARVLGHDQRQRSQPASSRAQRHDDARRRAQRVQPLEVPRVDGDLPQHRVVDVPQQPRLLRVAERVGRGRRPAGEHRR